MLAVGTAGQTAVIAVGTAGQTAAIAVGTTGQTAAIAVGTIGQTAAKEFLYLFHRGLLLSLWNLFKHAAAIIK